MACGRATHAPRSALQTRPSYVPHLDHILPYGKDSAVAADFQHEYLPFSLAKLTLPSCSAITSEAESVCGLIVEQAGRCLHAASAPCPRPATAEAV